MDGNRHQRVTFFLENPENANQNMAMNRPYIVRILRILRKFQNEAVNRPSIARIWMILVSLFDFLLHY